MDNELMNNNKNISSEKWDNMSKEEKITFVKQKMNEAKVQNDEDQYEYWNATLKKNTR